MPRSGETWHGKAVQDVASFGLCWQGKAASGLTWYMEWRYWERRGLARLGKDWLGRGMAGLGNQNV